MTDRELNRLIAVNLFGWVPMNNENGYSPQVRELRQPYPDYATYEGMGLVVEAMEAKGYAWGLRKFAGQYDEPEANFGTTVASADTAPCAVRLAALRALGVSEE